MSCETSTDLCHHPNNHGFDYFFGLPLTNFRNMGNDAFPVTYLPQFRLVFTSCVLLLLTAIVCLKLVGPKCGKILLILSVLLPVLAYSVYITYPYWNCVLMRNGDIVEQPVNLENMTPRLVNEGVRYLERQKEEGYQKPFLLYMSWVQVHTALHATEKFRGKFLRLIYQDQLC